MKILNIHKGTCEQDIIVLIRQVEENIIVENEIEANISQGIK